MTTSNPLIRWTSRLALGVLLVPMLFLIVSWLSPWSELNCWHEDVDVHSGRVRTQWYVCFVCVSEQIEDTCLSRAMLNESASPAPPDWRRVNTFSPGVRYSPHYRFHGAISDIRSLETIWEIGRFTPEARRNSGERVLALWRASGNYFQASDYIRQISEIAFVNDEAQRATTHDQLPP